MLPVPVGLLELETLDGCTSGVRIRGTLGDIDPLSIRSPLREPQVGFRRVPFRGSPLMLPRYLHLP